MAGLGENGFEIKSLPEIIEDIEVAQKSVFGSDLILDASSPDTQLNGLLAEQIAILWEIGLDVWASLDPRTAKGVQLDRICAIVGVVRKVSSPTIVTLDMVGTPNQVIQQGLVCSAEFIPETTFILASEVTLDGAGNASAQFYSSVNGAILVAPNTVTTIDTLVTGLDTVTNPLAGDTGDENETDEELRARRELSTDAVARSTLSSIYQAVLGVSGVTHLKIYENITELTENTIPPHSMMVCLNGGLNSDVASAIALNRPVGTGMVGNTVEPWEDDFDFTHNIFFERATEIPIFITINVNETSEWLSTTAQTIKETLLAYLDGSGIACDDFAGYSISDDVFSSDMYSPISNLGGFKITSITIDTSTPTALSQVPIDLYELATFDVDNMEVVNV